MGCCIGKNPPVRISVAEAEPEGPETPLRIRIKLRGEVKEATTEKVTQTLRQATGESPNRFETVVAESDAYYHVTIKPLEDDAPGATGKLSRRVINLILGKGMPITDNVKMIGAKEHLLAGEL